MGLVIFLIPNKFWLLSNRRLKVARDSFLVLHQESMAALSKFRAPGLTHFLVGLIFYLALNNAIGLAPYVFTATAHLSVTARLALPLLLALPGVHRRCNLKEHLAHLVPRGASLPLAPFLVLIEILRNRIRPLTLSVRLAANIVAGHLLLALLAGPAPLVSYPVLRLILVGLLLLGVLEIAVSFIQAYVFGTLICMYIREANSSLNH